MWSRAFVDHMLFRGPLCGHSRVIRGLSHHYPPQKSKSKPIYSVRGKRVLALKWFGGVGMSRIWVRRLFGDCQFEERPDCCPLVYFSLPLNGKNPEHKLTQKVCATCDNDSSSSSSCSSSPCTCVSTSSFLIISHTHSNHYRRSITS